MTSETDQAPIGTALHLPDAARALYDTVRDLPIVSPHGHCDPKWFATNQPFPDPASLLIVPDHYLFRMLYSQGVDLRDLGVGVPEEQRDGRAIFRLFASHWHKFRGIPSWLWMNGTLRQLFGISERLTVESADRIYDAIDARLRGADMLPNALLKSFNIEVLATTDGALDDLGHHKSAQGQDLAARVIPTFRPDSVINPDHPDYQRDLVTLGEITGEDTGDFVGYLRALQTRRAYFRDFGATATDHAVQDLMTCWLDWSEAAELFSKARLGQLDAAEANRLHGHMLTEMAQMSADDGMVMQLHAGSRRGTNHALNEAFGPDMGADIPTRTNWVAGLEALLNRVGNAPNMRLLAFTLDESSYARELALMAGHWPALRLGPPWWFHDSANGIERYLEQVVETAGYWNLAGFNDDTRAFISIPVRHDLWRRGVCRHLASQMEKRLFDRRDAEDIARLLSRDLAVDAYRL